MGGVVARVVVADKGFAAGRNPLERLFQLARGPGEHDLLGVVLAFSAEAAADVRRDHAHRVFRQVQLLGNKLADVMRHLGGGPDGDFMPIQAARGGGGRDHGARFQRRTDDAMVDDLDCHLVRGAREGLVHRRLAAALEAHTQVAGSLRVKLRRAFLGRITHIDCGRQRFPGDVDFLCRVLCLEPRGRHHHGDSFTHMAYRAARQRPARRLVHDLPVHPRYLPQRHHGPDLVRGHVGPGEYGHHPRHCKCGSLVDGTESRVRVR